MKQKRIYLAGPDVFFQHPDAHFDQLKKLCASYGLEGVVPSDGGLSQGLSGTGDEISDRIAFANIDLIRDCDAVLANLMPFRGKMEPDSGTVFEIGFACALGKPVAAYLPDFQLNYEDKVKLYYGEELRDGQPFDKEYGFLIESLGQKMNLMLSRTTFLCSEAGAGLAYLSKQLA